LIACNILARPLRRMAKDLARSLAPGGAAVLSGFLESDADAVLAAHRLQGLRLIRRITIDGWQTLIVGRRAAAGQRQPSGTPASSARVCRSRDGNPLRAPMRCRTIVRS
jgi:ribosomal protein L11 methyltransferase